jgi:hypothetical protein
MRWQATWTAVIFFLSLSASAQVEMVFSEKGRDFFSIPYPNDLHRYPDGRVDRKNFPVPLDNPLSVHYRTLADGMDGFAVSETVFIRFSGPVDSSKLPGAEESVRPDSPVFLVNIDRGSPAYGERIPVSCYFHTPPRGPLHNLLAIAPFPGFVLRENTMYAAVVLRSLDPGLTQSSVLHDLLAGKDPGGKLGSQAVEIFRPLADYLRNQKIPTEAVVAATVYTTGDPTRGLRAIMASIESLPPAKLDTPLEPYRDHPGFYALKSSFTSPQFQTGHGSELVHGGKILFDDQGRPIVQRYEKIPIRVMVPKGKMPKEGFPLVIYLHGGGNTSDEFLDHIIKSPDNQFTPGEGPARVFAAQGIAGVSSALVKNPERYGRFGQGNRFAELPFYNFFRGDVLCANHWQAAADNAVLLRLMRELTVDPALCPETDASAAADGRIRFNPSLFFGMGFSMGGTVLGNWAAVEPGIIASIPAGASGHWGLLIRNFTWGENLPWFYAWLIGGKKGEAMDARWPTLSLIQAVLEPCDTITFAPHVFRRPFPGHPARHVYLAFGAPDFYTKPVTQNAIVTALGLPLAGEVLEPSILVNQRLGGYESIESWPVSANVKSEDGRSVTAIAVQFEPDPWTHEGHNVDYNLTETKHQYGCFLRTLADTGRPVIPPPGPEGSPCGPDK